MIVAAIAIPNLLRARMAANEASAVGSLRSINIAAVHYATRFENGFPSSLEVLDRANRMCSELQSRRHLIDAVLTSGQQERIHLHLHSAVPE